MHLTIHHIIQITNLIIHLTIRSSSILPAGLGLAIDQLGHALQVVGILDDHPHMILWPSILSTCFPHDFCSILSVGQVWG